MRGFNIALFGVFCAACLMAAALVTWEGLSETHFNDGRPDGRGTSLQRVN